MKLTFYKYQGTGNDFVLMDNRKGNLHLTNEQVAFLCDRRFGIGADGLMLLENATNADFNMVYYNSDGHTSTMCGNGGRCITAFAALMGVEKEGGFRFQAIDGVHEAVINADGTVTLQMQDVSEIRHEEKNVILDTGSPHYVLFQDNVQKTDVFAEGRAVRNRDVFQPKGINVNFVERLPEGKGLRVRTYERGVEDETYSCGTGVTASAIAAKLGHDGHFSVPVRTKGGNLKVDFDLSNNRATNITLTGPATFVFKGEINID